ncbi:MAG: hypothetical protein RI897_1228 [Verrucomicrobiota bacterium]|jgi:CRP-like cAMP-binding protein
MKKVLFLFGELNDTDVDWLVSCGHPEHVSASATLIQEGQQIDAVYIVLEGSLEVTVGGPDQAITVVGPGEVLGEMSFLDSRPASTSIRARTESSVFRLPRAALEVQLASDPGFAARFYRSMCLFLSHRLRRMTLQTSAQDAAPANSADELDPKVLDGVHLAGKRFQRLIRHTSGS